MSSGKRPVPDFILGGASKCGTTSLWSHLKRHPGICMAATKEPLFFIDDPDTEQLGWPNADPTAVRGFAQGWEWYESLFRSCPEHTLRGEASTRYFHLPGSAALIKAHVPDVRLIFLLRHPVDRIVSHYWHDRRSVDLPPLPQMMRDRHPRFGTYVRISSYAAHVDRFRALFDDDRLLFLFSDDLSRDPTGVARTAARFVGADPDLLSDADLPRRNRSSVLRSRTISRLLDRRFAGPVWLKNWGRPVKRRLGEWNLRHVPYPDVPSAVYEELLDLLRTDVERVELALGKDLGRWKTRAPAERPG